MAVTSADIKEKARELGFTAAGVVPADRLEPEEQHLREWLSRGFHGTMAWMEGEPEKRADPTVLMPGCRSVLVCTLNYFTPHKHEPSPDHGKISRYAWGDDYHEVLRSKLKELLAWIHADMPHVGGKVCVDTAPFMDKAWAQRAGLGWIGKSTNLITREVGSWIFIGSLLLDIELDYDRPSPEDHCGTCTACLDACPTQAIVEPYVVDARRCISYSTIELRDETLPHDTAGWLYGCDVCQDVCPWNRFETPSAEQSFEPRGGETSISLESLQRMEHGEYVERFRGSAMKRTKLAGLKRNGKALLDAKG